MPELKEGTKVKDRYTLKKFKGSGSFGEVWLAHDEVLDTDVAIKIYISLDPNGAEEFKREYITAQGLLHPNLLTTNYFDVWEHRPFLVMKYCINGSSSSLAGNIDEYTLWQFIHDVAAGLRYLHSRPEPIIHQDIKPDNILIDDSDRFLITDFGISKKVRSTMRKQSKRAVGAGATGYMGPERFESDPTPVKASDIWSLGASIYELATGELPFNGLGGGMQRNGAELPALDNRWSKDLNMVMRACLTKETWDRPTALQLEEFSEAIINGKPATPTWNGAKIEEAHNETVESAGEDYDPEEIPDFIPEEPHSNKKRIWIAVGSMVAAIAVLLLIIFGLRTEDDNIVIPEDNYAEVSSTAEEDKAAAEANIPEVKPSEEAKEEPKVETPTKPAPQQPKAPKEQNKPEPKAQDNKASQLKTALAQGDYAQVQKLANQGYAPAYGPLAKYYLNNNRFETAEAYALKAKQAGYNEGSSVISALQKLGYYDDKD